MRAAAALIVLAGAGCDALLHLDDIHPPAPVVSYRKPIAITLASTITLSDVPVSIALDADSDLMMHAQPDGSDLEFDDGSNELSYEIVTYAGGTLDAWVRVTTLKPGITTIYLRYGTPVPPHDPTLAWPDSYAGVWHQSGDGTTSKDSTHHGHDLVEQGTSPPGAAAGIVGGARMFDEMIMQPMCSGDTDGSLEFDATSSFSYSVWVFVASSPAGSNIPFHKGGSSPGTKGYDLELGSLAWHAYLADGSANVMVEPSMSEQLGRWANVVIVVNRAAQMVYAYLDGSQMDMAGLKLGSLADSGVLMCLGGEPQAGPFGGLIDEARVVAGVPAPERIHFEQANLASRDQVIAVGPEEVVH